MSSCCVTAAVPKSSHYGFFGIIKHKLGLSGGGRHKKQVQDEAAMVMTSPGEVRMLESPQVVRIRCEEGVETIGPDTQGSPVVIRRKVGVIRDNLSGFNCNLELLASHQSRHTCVLCAVNSDCHGVVFVSAEYHDCLFHVQAEADTSMLFSRNLYSTQPCLLKIVTLTHCCNLQLSEQNDFLIISVFSCQAQCWVDQAWRWTPPLMSRGSSRSRSRRQIMPEPGLLKLRR